MASDTFDTDYSSPMPPQGPGVFLGIDEFGNPWLLRWNVPTARDQWTGVSYVDGHPTGRTFAIDGAMQRQSYTGSGRPTARIVKWGEAKL